MKPHSGWGIGILLLSGWALAACSSQPARPPAGLLGYGTPGVDRYVRDGQAGDLQAQLDLCRRVPQPRADMQTQGLPAACGQLRRTINNQPGNAVQP